MTRRGADHSGRGIVIPVLLTLAIGAVITTGIVLSIADHWRRGSALIAAAAILAAAARLALPTPLVGPLHVRSKAFDVVFLTAVAAVLALAAIGVGFETE